MGVEIPKPMAILSDNLGVTFIAKNSIRHIKLKYIVLNLHFVRKKTEASELVVKHVPGKNQWADILTKALSLTICLQNYNLSLS